VHRIFLRRGGLRSSSLVFLHMGVNGSAGCRPCCNDHQTDLGDMGHDMNHPAKIVQADDNGRGMNPSIADESGLDHFGGMPCTALQDEELCHFELELKELAQLSTNLPEGRRPPHRFSSRSVYTGQWRGNARHGYGSQTWPDGAVYEGRWVENSAEGPGKFSFVDGDIYIGQWKKNMFDGHGTYYNSNETTYYGEWHEDQRHGSGVEVGGGSQKDIQYAGTFHEGQKEGSGVCSWPDGSEYCGEWILNRITGAGSYASAQDGRMFKGHWSDSAKHGLGSYNWPDGRSYAGQYMRDEASGFGCFAWPDGRKYEGYWQSGKQHGVGQYTDGDGKRRLLLWKDGRPCHPKTPEAPAEAG